MTSTSSEGLTGRLGGVLKRLTGDHLASNAGRQASLYTGSALVGMLIAGIAKLVLANRMTVAEFAEVSFTLSLLQYLALVFFDFGTMEPASRLIAQAGPSRRSGVLGVALRVYVPLALVYSGAVLAVSFFADGIFEVKVGGDLRLLAPFVASWPLATYVGVMLARASERVGYSALATGVGQVFVLAVVLFIFSDSPSTVEVLLTFLVANWIAGLTLIVLLSPTMTMPFRPVASAVVRGARVWGTRAYFSRILSIGSYNMDILMLAAFASDRAVATYTLTATIAAACSVPSLAWSHAQYGKLASEQRISVGALRVTLLLSIVVLPLAVAGAWVATTFVLPPSYDTMVLLAIPLGVAECLRGLSALPNVFLASHGRGNELVWQGGVLTVSNLILNFLLIPPFGASGAAWASAAALAINMVSYLVLYRRVLGLEAAPLRPQGDPSPSTSSQPVDEERIVGDSTTGTRTIARLSHKVLRIGPHPIKALEVLRHRRRRANLDQGMRANYWGLVEPRPASVTLAAMPITLPYRGSDEPGDDYGRDRILDAADAAVAHRTWLLGSGGAKLGNPINWHRDPKSGYVWPSNTPSLDLEVTRLDDRSDAKLPWEISRSHQLVALARAARLTGNARYRDELETQLLDWIDSNEPGRGINWVNAMEVAIRGINWVWAANTLPTDLSLSPRVAQELIDSLRVHSAHIALNLEGSPILRGNHYLADEVGLFVLGWALEGDELATERGRSARKALEREILIQIHPDGFNFEASTAYHGLALELFLIAFLVAEWSGQPMSDSYSERLSKAVTAAASIERPDGRFPLFGDNDSARVLPLDEGREATYEPLVWLAAGVLGTPQPASGQPSPEVAWNAGLEAWQASTQRRKWLQPADAAFPDGGVWVAERGRSWVAIRCGDVGQLGNGGHAHNDALAFELAIDGRSVIVDPGTLVYTADPDLRNLFRSTPMHSTICLDDDEINPIDPELLFSMSPSAVPRATMWSSEHDSFTWSGYHDGWLRLGTQVVHSRDVALDADGVLKIEDTLTGSGRVVAVSTLILAPGIDASIAGSSVRLTAYGIECLATIEVAGASSEAFLDQIEVAPAYGVAQNALAIRIPISGTLPVHLVVEITPGKEHSHSKGVA